MAALTFATTGAGRGAGAGGVYGTGVPASAPAATPEGAPITSRCAAPSTREVRIAAKSDFRPLCSASAAEADARLCHHHLPPRPYAIDMTPKTTVVNM